MKNITIPEPCSENWNEMTPTQKGAFCQKCALDVYDFTNKSGDEIRTILAQSVGSRVCGRIENVQLAELNSDFEAWRINNSRSYQRAWIFTLFVVFGLTLFSCEEENIAKKMQQVGQRILTEQIAEFKESHEADGSPVAAGAMVMATGEESMQVAPFIETVEIEYLTMGVMAMEEPIIHENVLVPYNEIEVAENYILGAMRSSLSYEEYLEESFSTASDEIETVLSGLMYPNPATNESTLKLSMPNDANAVVNLYGLNGAFIREIHSGRVSKGDTEFGIDLTDLENGVYMVVIVSDQQKETVKFTKI